MWNSAAVFCGSKMGNNKIFAKHAEEIGLILAQKNIRLIYGGGRNGLMGIIADTVLKNNGKVMGIIPSLLGGKKHYEALTTCCHKNKSTSDATQGTMPQCTNCR